MVVRTRRRGGSGGETACQSICECLNTVRFHSASVIPTIRSVCSSNRSSRGTAPFLWFICYFYMHSECHASSFKFSSRPELVGHFTHDAPVHSVQCPSLRFESSQTVILGALAVIR